MAYEKSSRHIQHGKTLFEIEQDDSLVIVKVESKRRLIA